MPKSSTTRRGFLRSATTAGSALGLSGELTGFEHIVADEARPAKPREWSLRYDDGIEPLVQVMEELPLDTCVEELVMRLRGGLSYRRFMAALFLAGLRNGGDFGYYHCIYVIHSAHQLSFEAPIDERLMAMFGALGIFKRWQQDRYAGDAHFGWRKTPNELPSADKALSQYRAAIASGDPDGAEAALIVLGRTGGQQRMLEILAPYTLAAGVHGWICLSNTFRIFPVIGWQYAEPAMRMMARGYSAEEHWSEAWYAPRMKEVLTKSGPLPHGWSDSHGDRAATLEMLAAMREGNPDATLQFTYQQLAAGTLTAGSIWDAVHLAAGERFMHDHGDGNALHMNTGMNALHFTFRTLVKPELQLMTLMRAVVWTSQPQGAVRNLAESKTLAYLVPADIPALPKVAAEDIINSSAADDNAVGKAFAFALQHPDSQALWQARRRLVVAKGADAHPYKYLAAIREDTQQVSPEWRAHISAASVAGNTGLLPPDAPVILRAREALRGV